MAEASAAAAAAVSQHRFFCHSCKGEVSPKLPVSQGRSERPGRGRARGKAAALGAPQSGAGAQRGAAGGQRCPHRVAGAVLGPPPPRPPSGRPGSPGGEGGRETPAVGVTPIPPPGPALPPC